MHKLWDTIVRWRTWLVNLVFGLMLTPDLVLALLGFNWSLIIPPPYVHWISLAVVILNVWMRPRPAVRAHDPEARVAK